MNENELIEVSGGGYKYYNPYSNPYRDVGRYVGTKYNNGVAKAQKTFKRYVKPTAFGDAANKTKFWQTVMSTGKAAWQLR